MQERVNREEEIKREKHEEVLRRIEKRKQIMSIENQRSKQIHQDYLKFLTHRKHAHEKLEEKYEQQRAEENK